MQAIDRQASYTAYNPTALRFARVARVCERQLAFLNCQDQDQDFVILEALRDHQQLGLEKKV